MPSKYKLGARPMRSKYKLKIHHENGDVWYGPTYESREKAEEMFDYLSRIPSNHSLTFRDNKFVILRPGYADKCVIEIVKA